MLDGRRVGMVGGRVGLGNRGEAAGDGRRPVGLRQDSHIEGNRLGMGRQRLGPAVHAPVGEVLPVEPIGARGVRRLGCPQGRLARVRSASPQPGWCQGLPARGTDQPIPNRFPGPKSPLDQLCVDLPLLKGLERALPPLPCPFGLFSRIPPLLPSEYVPIDRASIRSTRTRAKHWGPLANTRGEGLPVCRFVRRKFHPPSLRSSSRELSHSGGRARSRAHPC